MQPQIMPRSAIAYTTHYVFLNFTHTSVNNYILNWISCPDIIDMTQT